MSAQPNSHAGRASTLNLGARIDQLCQDTAENAALETDVFDLVDRDGNGSLSREEFSRVVQAIKANVVRSHRLKLQTEKAARHAKLLRIAAAVVVLMGATVLLGNVGLTYTVYRLSKDMHVSGSRGVNSEAGTSHAVMTDRRKHVVQTGLALAAAGDDELASAADTDLPQRLQGMRYLSGGDGTRYAGLEAWSMSARNVSVVTLSDGAVMAFDGAASALLQAPSGVVMPGSSAALRDLCSAHGCGLERCVGLRSLSEYLHDDNPDDLGTQLGLLHSATCDGSPAFWTWGQAAQVEPWGAADFTLAHLVQKLTLGPPVARARRALQTSNGHINRERYRQECAKKYPTCHGCRRHCYRIKSGNLQRRR